MKFQAKMYNAVLFVMIAMICVSNALAVLETQTYGFYNITHNSMNNAMTGEAQLSVTASDQGSMTTGDGTFNRVGFKFNNSGPDDCVITEIYFQGSSLLEYVSMDKYGDVVFDETGIGAVSPGNLPGGNSITPAFVATTVFSIEPVGPEPYWGVGPGEWLEIVYTLQAGKTYENIIEELDDTLLRIGIHVQSFADDGSESFITPEPVTMFLLGLGGLVMRKRR